VFGRVSKAIKVPTCLLIVAVGICVVGFALREMESQVFVLTRAKSVRAMRADFDQYACLEKKLHRLIPAGAEVYDTNPETSLYNQRVLEFASAGNIVVPTPSPRSWTVSTVRGTACGRLDLKVVPPRAKATP
jgi:hypothetical protein